MTAKGDKSGLFKMGHYLPPQFSKYHITSSPYRFVSHGNPTAEISPRFAEAMVRFGVLRLEMFMVIGWVCRRYIT